VAYGCQQFTLSLLYLLQMYVFDRHKRQKACYRNLKRTFEDLWPCSCYALKDNSRTIGSQVWQIPFAGKGADIVNCKLHDTRTVNLAVVKSVSYRNINCYCKNKIRQSDLTYGL